MRTRICYPFILLIALLTTVSCENELPFSVKDNPPKLVMNALINADSQKVYVRSHPRRKEICNAVSIFPANLLPEM